MIACSLLDFSHPGGGAAGRHKTSQVTQPALFQILENTPENHVDHSSLKLALERAEELCSQVNEGVREKENSDRLEWIQTHVQCEGLTEVGPVGLSCMLPGRLWVGNQVHAFPWCRQSVPQLSPCGLTILPLLGCHLPFS